MTIPYTNDGSADAPKLKVYLHTAVFTNLESTAWSGAEGSARFEQIKADGFDGVQHEGLDTVESSYPFALAMNDRINTAADALPVAQKYMDKGCDCLTVHAGWGIEDEAEMFGIVEAILKASEQCKLPIYIETHRATLTQDMWRTVQITKKFPEVRFNGDFSHYYCGQEMPYGGTEMKLDFMAPIFERVAFMHGRIASSGAMQADVGNGQGRPACANGEVNYLDDFKEMWTRAMTGFLKNAGTGDYLIVCPELLDPTYYYARTFMNAEGKHVQESDRYAQSLVYKDIFKACFAAAGKRLA